MARPRSDSFTVTLQVVLSRPDVQDMPERSRCSQNSTSQTRTRASTPQWTTRFRATAIRKSCVKRNVVFCLISVGFWMTRRRESLLGQGRVATRHQTPGRGGDGGGERVSEIALTPSLNARLDVWLGAGQDGGRP